MSKLVQTAILTFVLGAVIGVGITGWRLSSMQSKAASEYQRHKAYNEKAVTLQEASLDMLRKAEESAMQLSLYRSDYALLKKAVELGAIDLERAPEIAEILNRELPTPAVKLVATCKD